MGKIKKFFDFEIVTILTIIILISPFYLIARYTETTEDIKIENRYEIYEYQTLLEFNKITSNKAKDNQELLKLQIKDFDDNLLYISSSDVEVLGLFVGVVTIIVNIFTIFIYIIKYLIKIIIISRNRKILEGEDIENILISNYDVTIANTLYTGRIGFGKIYSFFKKRFIEKGLIDKEGNIEPNINIKDLNELEQKFISLYENEVKYDVKVKFKEEIIKDLENKGYLRKNKVRVYIDYACNKIESAGRWLYKKDKDDPLRIILDTTLPFVVLILIAALKYLSIVLILAIAYIQLKYYNIFLTKEGKKEKAKICLLLNDLKNKEELQDNEKYFYEALKFRVL